MYPVFVGQYWQSVKAHSGSVCLSYLAAQRRDCEETDAVNALASLSVGVLSNERYGTPFDPRTRAEAEAQIQSVTHHATLQWRVFLTLSSSIPDEPMEHDSDSI